jgi:hypothetical protein
VNTQNAAKVLTVILLILLVGCNLPLQRNETPEVSEGGREILVEEDKANEVDDQDSSSQIVGSITNIRTNVQAGPLTNLKKIEEKTELGNEDFVKVTDGGKARLEFPGPVNLLLYNETEIDGVRTEVDENYNPRIFNRMIRGGLSGYVAPGADLTIDLAKGLQVTVLGTNFFIIYDEESGNVTIGKFDGTLVVDLPNQSSIFLDDNEMIDLIWDGVLRIRSYYEIPFSVNQFDEAADECFLPVQGFNILRRDNSIPLPGDVFVNDDQSLPCDSGPPQALIPLTGCIQNYDVEVKSNKVDLREGPDVRYKKVGEYNAGTQYTITGRYTDVWFFGELPDGNKGWLYNEWLELPSELEINNICKLDSPPTPVPCYSKGKYSERCP